MGALIPEKDKEVVVKQFGLLGRLSPWPFNTVVVVPQVDSSPELIKSLLEKVDSAEDSRPAMKPFSDLTGHPHFIGRGGEKGLQGHKVFASSLPSRHRAYLTAISETKEAFREGFAKSRKVNDIFLIEIVRSVLIQLMLGCKLTPAMNKLLDEMQQNLLHHRPLSNVKQDYKQLLQESIHDRIMDDKSCMLSSMLNEKFPLPSSTASTLDRAKKQQNAIADPDISVLPTMLVVAQNVTNALETILRNISYAEVTVLLSEMKDNRISTLDDSSLDQIDEKLARLNVLDSLFKEGLRRGQFDPEVIYRYTSKAIKVENTKVNEETIIPANSWLAIHHRAPIHSRENFDLHRYENSNAPQLNTQFFAPFSLGKRRCPGQRLAEDIVKGVLTVMAEILHESFWNGKRDGFPWNEYGTWYEYQKVLPKEGEDMMRRRIENGMMYRYGDSSRSIEFSASFIVSPGPTDPRLSGIGIPLANACCSDSSGETMTETEIAEMAVSHLSVGLAKCG